MLFVSNVHTMYVYSSEKTQELTEINIDVEYRVIESQPGINQEELHCLATNIYFEARGEPILGQIAVAQVTFNRVKSRRFPNTICEVVYQARLNHNGNPLRNKCQFSWYCDGMKDTIHDSTTYQRILKLSESLIRDDNEFDDLVDGAEYYHSNKVKPYWSNQFLQTASINDHIFYRDGLKYK